MIPYCIVYFMPGNFSLALLGVQEYATTVGMYIPI